MPTIVRPYLRIICCLSGSASPFLPLGLPPKEARKFHDKEVVLLLPMSHIEVRAFNSLHLSHKLLEGSIVPSDTGVLVIPGPVSHTIKGCKVRWTDVTPEAGSRLMMAAKCWALKSAAMLL